MPIIFAEYGSEGFQSTDLKMFDGCSYYNEIAQTTKQLPRMVQQAMQQALAYEGAVLLEVLTNPYVPVLPPHTSLGVLSHYLESQVKLAKAGRLKESWLSLKTSIKYLRDLW